MSGSCAGIMFWLVAMEVSAADFRSEDRLTVEAAEVPSQVRSEKRRSVELRLEEVSYRDHIDYVQTYFIKDGD